MIIVTCVAILSISIVLSLSIRNAMTFFQMRYYITCVRTRFVIFSFSVLDECMSECMSE